MPFQTVTTVVTPPASFLLTDLPTVRMELDLAADETEDDAWLTTKLKNVSFAIHRHCNRVFPAQTIQDLVYVERDAYPWQVPGGVQPLQLSNWPVIAITSVTVADPTIGVLQPTTGYTLDPKPGQLIRVSSFTGCPMAWEASPTTIVYQAGYAEIPGDVVEAALKMITKAWWQRGTNPALKMREQPSGREEFWVSTGGEGNMPPDIQDLLNPYRVPVVA